MPASGVAGVVVAPELRRTGLARRLLTALLASACEGGAVISTLFPTTPELYRALGYGEVGALTWTAVPAAALAGVRVPRELELRAAGPDDVPAVSEAYRAIAREGAGMMERAGPLFDTSPEAVLASHDGLTVAIGPKGTLEGYASWDRRAGYDARGAVAVPDLVALTASATIALVGMLGGWAVVAPTLSLRLPPESPVRLLAPLAGARVESSDPWMLRVLDAPRAIAARGWPAQLEGSAELRLDDDVCPWNAGRGGWCSSAAPGG